MGMFDDTPVATLPVTGGFTQGPGPSHLQAVHARSTRARIAPSHPDSIQRAGPARHTIADTPSPQTYPLLASTDHIDVDAALGLEGAKRPGQQPVAGWDGEQDGSAPDWTLTTIW